MRGTVAKRLRRISRVRTGDVVQYVMKSHLRRAPVPVEINAKGFVIIDRPQRLCAGSTPRARYLQSKRLYRFAPKLFAKHVFMVGI